MTIPPLHMTKVSYVQRYDGLVVILVSLQRTVITLCNNVMIWTIILPYNKVIFKPSSVVSQYIEIRVDGQSDICSIFYMYSVFFSKCM